MASGLNRGQKLCSFGRAPICFGSRTGAEYDKQPLPKALPALVLVVQKHGGGREINMGSYTKNVSHSLPSF